MKKGVGCEREAEKRMERAAGTVKAVIYLLIVVILLDGLFVSDAVVAAGPGAGDYGDVIDSKLEAAGELDVAKMIYNGLIHYSDGSIPFLTQKAFNMTYRAEVRAGVNLAKANTEVTDSEVTVTLPAVEFLIFPSTMIPSSITMRRQRF